MQFHHLKAMALASSAVLALTGSAAWAQAPARAQFDIPAQDLGAALRTFGVQAGREVLFDPALVNGKRAPAIQGDMSVSTAVNRLLAGQFEERLVVALAVPTEARDRAERGAAVDAEPLRLPQQPLVHEQPVVPAVLGPRRCVVAAPLVVRAAPRPHLHGLLPAQECGPAGFHSSGLR